MSLRDERKAPLQAAACLLLKQFSGGDDDDVQEKVTCGRKIDRQSDFGFYSEQGRDETRHHRLIFMSSLVPSLPRSSKSSAAAAVIKSRSRPQN